MKIFLRFNTYFIYGHICPALRPELPYTGAVNFNNLESTLFKYACIHVVIWQIVRFLNVVSIYYPGKLWTLSKTPVLVRGLWFYQFKICTFWGCLGSNFTNCSILVFEKNVFPVYFTVNELDNEKKDRLKDSKRQLRNNDSISVNFITPVVNYRRYTFILKLTVPLVFILGQYKKSM